MTGNPYQPLVLDFGRVWWREIIIYEIYVQSFQDSNNDGIGDLRGIINRLDYLKKLGVDMLWLTPIYESPLDDQGYDISNYKKIHPQYGTMEDWEELCEKVHEKGMKLMMDMVFNHSSSEHEWFKESRKSKDNPKRNWYFWKKGKIGKNGEKMPPNNWGGLFGGRAWKYDPTTDEWYLHLFAETQPDLNWDNPEVREAVYDTIDFWAKKGTDGFRLDVINLISKTPGLPDAPVTEPDQFEQNAIPMFTNGPKVHEYIHEMNLKVLRKYNCCTVGEMPCGVSQFEASQYVGKERRELSMVFQFDHMDLDGQNGNKWKPRKFELPELERVMRSWQQHMLGNNGWSSLYLENHDQPRAVSRFGSQDPKYRVISAKMLATFLLTLRGTPFLYQGQELGFPHPQKWKIEDYPDLETQAYYKSEYDRRKAANPTKEPDMSDVMHAIRLKGRDNARFPMHWDKSPNAGFSASNVKPWIKMNDESADINVQQQDGDPDSVLNYFRRLLHMRKQHPLMCYGAYVPINPTHPKIMSFLRAQGPWSTLVICNFSTDNVDYVVPDEIDIDLAVPIIANYPLEESKFQRKTCLKPYEARVYSLRN
ncbi:CAZyme family GH13 [Paecilomyces variotii]|nr:CAZyme family GH13 [Paecilomyces variotii]KAJ9351651.1 CAZyme family GH13 [Paecilomyces variotii]KAJ9410578.1 CAZyme family GH13 [Paecilomyces variotii]